MTRNHLFLILVLSLMFTGCYMSRSCPIPRSQPSNKAAQQIPQVRVPTAYQAR